MPASFGPRLAPGSPQVVRRKTIARQWPPAPTPRTPAPAPAAATGKKEPSNDYFAYVRFTRASDTRAQPSYPLSIALIKGERPFAGATSAGERGFVFLRHACTRHGICSIARARARGQSARAPVSTRRGERAKISARSVKVGAFYHRLSAGVRETTRRDSKRSRRYRRNYAHPALTRVEIFILL